MKIDPAKTIEHVFARCSKPQALQFLQTLSFVRDSEDAAAAESLISDLEALLHVSQDSFDPHSWDEGFRISLPAFKNNLVAIVREFEDYRSQRPPVEVLLVNLEPRKIIEIGYEVVHDIAVASQKQPRRHDRKLLSPAQIYENITNKSGIMLGKGIKVNLSSRLTADPFQQSQRVQLSSPRTPTLFQDISREEWNCRHYMLRLSVLGLAPASTSISAPTTPMSTTLESD